MQTVLKVALEELYMLSYTPTPGSLTGVLHDPIYEHTPTSVKELLYAEQDHALLQDRKLAHYDRLSSEIQQSNPKMQPYLDSLYLHVPNIPLRDRVVGSVVNALNAGIASTEAFSMPLFWAANTLEQQRDASTDRQQKMVLAQAAEHTKERATRLQQAATRSCVDNILSGIVTLGTIAEKGYARANIHGRRTEFTTIGDGMITMYALGQYYQEIKKTITHPNIRNGNRIHVNTQGVGAWRILFDHSDTTSLYIRPHTEANLDDRIEYGKPQGPRSNGRQSGIVGASISWCVDATGEKQRHSYPIEKSKNEFSQRLDNDFIVAHKGGKTNLESLLLNSANGGESHAVLDTGSTVGNLANSGTVIGLFLSVGDSILMSRGRKPAHLNHRPLADRLFGTTTEFADLAFITRNYFSQPMSEQRMAQITKEITATNEGATSALYSSQRAAA